MVRRANLNVVLHVPDDYKLSGYEDRINHSVVKARRAPKRRACPDCGCRGHVHERETRKVYHLPVKGVPLVVLLEVVRFKCPGCGRTYYDDYGDLVSGLSPHITADLEFQIALDIAGKMSIAAVSRKEGPSEELVTKVLDAAVLKCAYLPRTLCIDEFAAHTEKGRFAVAVSDGDNRCLVEVLERPRGDVLGDFFGTFSERERARVAFFCCDMSGTFIAAKELWFPRAKLCIDRFHVVKEVAGAFNKVRVRVTDSKELDGNGNPTKKDRFTAGEKKEIKRARYWFRMRRPELERLDAEYATELAERRDRLRGQLADMDPRDLDDLVPRPRAPKCGRVDALLEWDRELKAAYQLLQWFYLWSDMKWCADKRDGLERWCKAAMRSGIPEFKAVAKTFRRHREGILNGYKHGKTNALAEGLNNTIKLLKKTSYGMPTFARMRRRCLFTLGYYRLERDHVHLPQVDDGCK